MNPLLFIIIAALWLAVVLAVKRDKVKLTDDDLEIGEKNETTTGKL